MRLAFLLPTLSLKQSLVLFSRMASGTTPNSTFSHPFQCDGGSQCHSECELLHLDKYEKAVQSEHKINSNATNACKSNQAKLIICSGPERSGSTWLYNAIRHLHAAADIPCDSYWIHQLTPDKLKERLECTNNTVLIKTHKYYNAYNNWLFDNISDKGDKDKNTNTIKPIVILTHRDLRDVLISYRRLGWAYNIHHSYVDHHFQWLPHATLDVNFDNIINNTSTTLQEIAQACQIDNNNGNNKTFTSLAQERLDKMRKTSKPMYGVDQVTKHWPSHIKTDMDNTNNNRANFDYLLEKYPEFYTLYKADFEKVR